MTSRALKIALVASLTANVFIVGAVGGAIAMRHRMMEQRAKPPMGNPLMRIAQQLPKDVGVRYIARVREQSQASRPQMMEARAARTEAAKVLAAPQYDPAAASVALARARAADDATRAALENAVVDFARTLKPEERRVIAQSLRGGRDKDHDRDRDRDHDRDHDGDRGRNDRRGPPAAPQK